MIIVVTPGGQHGPRLRQAREQGLVQALVPEPGVEALAAGLTGSHYALKASSFLDDKGPAPATGQLLIAIDPTSCSGGIDHLARLFAVV